ncbi:Sugar fermentation stimulation protein homolog [Candidatus Desulfarcum epimagneticum]|uniref:Sugar fermentation stimulation protein homolog n=1 Tax=uncultured Desulfobacteraceae bacterium TaxID=218296 RepID=A0A484HNV0_9BACT|nr:Sugar fermentation stimulation protein homolog [uncultured Desulfobacteraceae bacterium]
MKQNPETGLAWPRLFKGTLIKRYKRFLADAKLENGEVVVAHCPNPGSMRACCEPGRTVYLSFHDNPKRKLKYTWEMIEMPASLVGVNTLVPNRLVKKSLENGMIPEISSHTRIRSEVRVSKSSRLDFVAEKENGEKCFVEVKNCALVENGAASFPDAVTERGKKHLVELQELVKKGSRGVIFFLIQRMDAESFAPAADIDPAYAREFEKAVENGVEPLVYDVQIDLSGISLGKRILTAS